MTGVPKMLKGREKEPHYHTKDGDIVYAKDLYSTKEKKVISQEELDKKMSR